MLGVESFRREHGISSRDSALGHEGEGGAEGWQRNEASESQRRLGLEQQRRQLERSMQRSQEMESGFDLGIG